MQRKDKKKMTENESIIALEERQKAMEARLGKVEAIAENINNLTISVERMSVVLESQVKEQIETNARLKRIENEPRDAWKNVKSQVIAALISGIITAIFFSANK